MRRIALFAAVVALLVPGVAHAATAEVSNGVLIYVSGASDSTVSLDGPACYSPFPGPCPPDRFLVRILDFGGFLGRPAGEAITPGTGCAYGEDIFGPPGPGQPPTPWPPDHEVYCSGVDSFNVSLGAGSDWLFASTDLPGTYFGGDGDDRFQDGSANDFVFGGPGADVFEANPGNDLLSGQDGSDAYYALDCPAPPDPCDPAVNSALDTGRDSFSGGAGRDTADFSDIFAAERLSADGAQNDGKPGEGDNIAGDVEDILAGPFADTLVGNADANRLDGGAGSDAVVGGPGNDVLQGAAGSDSLDGGAGADALHGGPDVDSVSFADRAAAVRVTLDDRADDGESGEGDDVGSDVEDVLGGSGADDLTGSASSNRLDGGAGEDFLDGGGGGDTLVGGDAADVLRLRDSSVEASSSCGPGVDFVIADPGESGGPDCEDVDNVLSDQVVLGQQVAVQPGGATLGLQLPAAHRLVPLFDHVNIPVGSLIDTTAGVAKVTSRAVRSRRRRQSGRFSGALIQLFQARARAKRGLTEVRLKGGSFDSCLPGGGRAGAAQLSRRTIRRLRGQARGRFRTRGRHSSATVRGTIWITADRCDGTLTKVRRGKVAVRDFRRRRTILVRAGKSYLARARR